MTASQQPDAERAPLTSPAAAGSGPTGHDKAVSLVAQKINDALVEATAEHLAGQGPPDTAWFIHEAQASAAAAIAALRAALAAGNVGVAEALGLSEQWAVRYERTGDPTMDNPSGVVTVEQPVSSEDHARQAVKNSAPISARRRRSVSRFVTDWTEVAP